MLFEEIVQIPPYSLNSCEKEKLFNLRLIELTKYHEYNCVDYKKILNSNGINTESLVNYKDVPFLPVRLFKETQLKSVPDENVVKVMTSSGTSGQEVSKIYLDKITAANQQKAMVKIVSDFTGSSRMPMIIIDCPSVVKNRKMFSARGAGILGFSIFGSQKIYALDDEMNLNFEEVKAFIEKNKGKQILLFGFTFMIWKYFYKALLRRKEQTGEVIDLSNAILIHGGGWKKLINEAVGTFEFREKLKNICGLKRIHDYYGMVEQTGCIYMECECGHLHTSIFSDVITRRARDFSICDRGESGIIQVVSTIPESYPGHSLLTEDEGIIMGEDDCPCGRKGKYFKVLGRIKNAEIRGCSDTYTTIQSHTKQNSKLYFLKSHLEEDFILSRINYLAGNKGNIKFAQSVVSREAFDDRVIKFCSDVSKELMCRAEAKVFPDIVTLGFWLRNSSLSKWKDMFVNNTNVIKLGRGVAFHVAPSNVPINFAYSLFTGLLAGNINIVRVPSKNYPQINIIINVIEDILKKYENMKPYITLIRYEKNQDINDYLSRLCDVRIVWGGNATISELRKSPLNPRSTEVTFSDRYSLAVIDAEYYMNSDNKERIAQDFYNDTYLSDQNACTSPRVIVWIGKSEKIEEAKMLFWRTLHMLVEKKYNLRPVQCVDKLSMQYMSEMYCSENGLHMVNMEDNLITRIHVEKLTKNLMNYKGNSGYFYEYDMSDIMEMKDISDSSCCQTIGIIGDSKLLLPLISSGVKGIDRIVPIGHTMDFELLWDGYNLVERLTRNIVIK